MKTIKSLDGIRRYLLGEDHNINPIDQDKMKIDRMLKSMINDFNFTNWKFRYGSSGFMCLEKDDKNYIHLKITGCDKDTRLIGTIETVNRNLEIDIRLGVNGLYENISLKTLIWLSIYEVESR